MPTPAATPRFHGTWLRICLVILPAIIVGGTVGYRVIEGWPWDECLYMTVITVSTVGFGETHPLSPAGRTFTILLITVGVATVAIAITGLFEAIVERQVRFIRENQAMKDQIQSLSQHIILCGYGRMGRLIAEDLAREHRRVVVIDNTPAATEDAERHGFVTLPGDAAAEDVLQQAGIDRAAALVATLGTDADNLLLTMTARGMKADLPIIARAGDQDNCAKFRRAGATRVVSPYATGANHIVRLLTRPAVVDFVELVTRGGDVRLEVKQIGVTPESPFAHRTLSEGHVRQHVGGMVLAIRRADGSTHFDPAPDTRLEPGDELVVVGAARHAGDTGPGPSDPETPNEETT